MQVQYLYFGGNIAIQAIRTTPVISTGIKNIHILLVEINNGRLGLGLSPDMKAHQIFREMREVHKVNYNSNR